MLSPGMYGQHPFTAMEQLQMAYLNDWSRSQTFDQPNTQPFLDSVSRLNHISEIGSCTVRYNGSLPYPDQKRVVENYDQNPPNVETLSAKDAVSEMKKQLHFLD